MNVSKVTYGFIASTLMAASLGGCTEPKYENKAKEQAVKYLRGDELLKAERFARQQYNSDQYNGEAITYWDSIVTEAKVKEAYIQGQQFVKDSIKGIYHRKTKYKAPLDTVMTNDIIETPKNEYAKLVSAEDFIKARNNAPNDYGANFANNLVGSTHYWNLITLAGRQKEAYNQGMADARKELNK